MMATTPDQLVQSSPKAPAALAHVATKRPSLSPRKRKLSDASADDSRSPTATSEVASANGEDQANSNISPKKKVKTEKETKDADVKCSWDHLDLALRSSESDEVDEVEAGSDEACQKVLAAYAPVPWADAPSEALTATELEILDFFLA